MKRWTNLVVCCCALLHCTSVSVLSCPSFSEIYPRPSGNPLDRNSETRRFPNVERVVPVPMRQAPAQVEEALREPGSLYAWIRVLDKGTSLAEHQTRNEIELREHGLSVDHLYAFIRAAIFQRSFRPQVSRSDTSLPGHEFSWGGRTYHVFRDSTLQAATSPLDGETRHRPASRWLIIDVETRYSLVFNYAMLELLPHYIFSSDASVDHFTNLLAPQVGNATPH